MKMASEQENDKQTSGQTQQTQQQTQQQAAKVELNAEQYTALLDRLAELETLVAKATPARQEVTDIDQLAREAKVKPVEEEELPKAPEDLDQMSNKELADYILSQVNQAGQQLMTEVMTLKVLREIDKCESKYEDFWDYQEEVQRIATQNPSLNIEQAYKLAKVSKEEQAKTKQKEKSEAKASEPLTQKLLKLPPRPTPGEKSGVAPGSTKPGEFKTVRDAALKAWEEVVGKGKTEIS
jgi:hypothetical protein